MVLVRVDWILGGHACAIDVAVYVSVYTVAEELGDGGGSGAGPLYEQNGRGKDHNRSRR